VNSDAGSGCVISIPLEIAGEAFSFVVLDDGSLIIEDQAGEESLETVATVIERHVARPYRARGFRGEERWVVVADAVELIDLGAFGEDDVTLVAIDGTRRFVVGGALRPESDIPDALLAAAEESEPCVVSCAHVDEQWWELTIDELPS
jgi:hypothetical protein